MSLDSMQIPVGPRLGGKVIDAEGLSKAFGDKLLMDGVSFSIPAGSIVGAAFEKATDLSGERCSMPKRTLLSSRCTQCTENCCALPVSKPWTYSQSQTAADHLDRTSEALRIPPQPPAQACTSPSGSLVNVHLLAPPQASLDRTARASPRCSRWCWANSSRTAESWKSARRSCPCGWSKTGTSTQTSEAPHFLTQDQSQSLPALQDHSPALLCINAV